MVQTVIAIKSPFTAIRQIWRDYKVGRATRQKTSNMQLGQPLCAESQRPKTLYSTGGWQHRPFGEFPWRFEQTVREESNWRGTWVLEVKDMLAMEWEIVRVPKENSRGGKYQRKPTCHLPFLSEGPSPALLPSEGGQDDLMVWLGKP